MMKKNSKKNFFSFQNRNRLALKRAVPTPISKKEGYKSQLKFTDFPSNLQNNPSDQHFVNNSDLSVTESACVGNHSETSGHEESSVTSSESAELTPNSNEDLQEVSNDKKVIWDEDSMDARIRKPYDNDLLNR